MQRADTLKPRFPLLPATYKNTLPILSLMCHVVMTTVIIIIGINIVSTLTSDQIRLTSNSVAIKEVSVEIKRRKVNKKIKTVSLRYSRWHTAIRPSYRKWRPHASRLHFLSFLSTFQPLCRQHLLKLPSDQSFLTVSALYRVLASFSDPTPSDYYSNYKKIRWKEAKIK